LTWWVVFFGSFVLYLFSMKLRCLFVVACFALFAHVPLAWHKEPSILTLDSEASGRVFEPLQFNAIASSLQLNFSSGNR
jgi:hypothetical protein